MNEIRISRRHGLSDETAARAEIEQLAGTLTERFGGRWSWQGDVAVCDIRGARGEVRCRGDRVDMRVRLPMVLLPLRASLEREIRRRFDAHFRPRD